MNLNYLLFNLEFWCMRNFSKKLIAIQILLLFCALSIPAMAIGQERVRLGFDADAIDIYKVLTGKTETTRSVGEMPENGVDNKKSILEAPIEFEYDSANLTGDDVKFIHKIGMVFGYEREGGDAKRLLVRGHTDSKGTDEYNKVLSLKRAQAIKNYLRKEFSFNFSEIRVEGLGEGEPAYYPATAAENRRIEFELE